MVGYKREHIKKKFGSAKKRNGGRMEMTTNSRGVLDRTGSLG